MKTIWLVLGMFAVLMLAGCGDDITNILEPDDLAPPLGLQSVTLDSEIFLTWWTSNYDNDLLGYKIYLAEGDLAGDALQELPAAFTAIDSMEVTAPSSGPQSITIDGLTNGTTYSFLVVSVKDEWNDISHTSNVVADTPRPETGAMVQLTARQEDATTAGMEMSDFSVVDCTDLDGNYDTTTGGDIMCERFNPGAGSRLWFDGINGAVLQDIGYMVDMNNADVAPADGYTESGHSVEALVGHVYALMTADNHYAKFRVVSLNIGSGVVQIVAANQTQANNPDYK